MNNEPILKIYCDGGARGNPGPGAAAFVVEKDGRVVYKESKFLGTITNNIAEYTAVIQGLKWLGKNQLERYTENIFFILDSELVAKQLSGNFKVKNENLRNLFFTVKSLEKKISRNIFYRSVSRTKNKLADFLVNKTLDENSSKISRQPTSID